MTDPYIARIVSYTEGKDPITMQGETPAILKRLIDGVSEKELKRSPAPGKWSVAEILAHLAESEIVIAYPDRTERKPYRMFCIFQKLDGRWYWRAFNGSEPVRAYA